VAKFQQAGVKKVILDLRDNPGGEVDSAQDITSLVVARQCASHARKAWQPSGEQLPGYWR